MKPEQKDEYYKANCRVTYDGPRVFLLPLPVFLEINPNFRDELKHEKKSASILVRRKVKLGEWWESYQVLRTADDWKAKL